MFVYIIYIYIICLFPPKAGRILLWLASFFFFFWLFIVYSPRNVERKYRNTWGILPTQVRLYTVCRIGIVLSLLQKRRVCNLLAQEIEENPNIWNIHVHALKCSQTPGPRTPLYPWQCPDFSPSEICCNCELSLFLILSQSDLGFDFLFTVSSSFVSKILSMLP